MAPETVRALRAINDRFYRTHAELFAAKRTRPWPGMQRLLRELPRPPRQVLDVGCGHGRFAALLAEQQPDAEYTGVDASPELLALATSRADGPRVRRLVRLDVQETPDALPPGPFDLVTLIAVLHHVPGEDRRLALLRTLAGRVAPGGTLALAFWRRIGDEEKRRVPFEEVGIDGADTEDGDRLTSFGEGKGRLRYGHFPDDAELDRMEEAPGLPLRLRYLDDGPEGRANAYFLWTPAQ